MLHTLTNTYHGTSIRIRSTESTAQEAWFLIQYAALGSPDPTTAAKRRYHKIRSALCGVSGCQCGTVRS